MNSAPFGMDTDLLIISPAEPFEVDGILYTPPWLDDRPRESVDEISVHYGPMFDLKEEYWAHPEDFEDL